MVLGQAEITLKNLHLYLTPYTKLKWTVELNMENGTIKILENIRKYLHAIGVGYFVSRM